MAVAACIVVRYTLGALLLPLSIWSIRRAYAGEVGRDARRKPRSIALAIVGSVVALACILVTLTDESGTKLTGVPFVWYAAEQHRGAWYGSVALGPFSVLLVLADACIGLGLTHLLAARPDADAKGRERR